MEAKLIQQAVGPWPMNSYAVIDDVYQESIIIDPGADPEKLLSMVAGTKVEKILLTHGHGDHIMALEEVKAATGASIYLHPKDAEHFDLIYDVPLQDGMSISVGQFSLTIIHTPGHTPGQCCFDLGDGRIIVGDTIFVGGPGRTWSAEDFKTTMQTMQNIVFKWPDETNFFPGHGPSGNIGIERSDFEAFVAQGWSENLEGDVTWAVQE
jgi:glyoxylase-like metal-dependent hydrolase (beta-lactamase superfamily II)